MVVVNGDEGCPMKMVENDSGTAVSSVVFIYDTSTVIFGHIARVRFKHVSSFRLVWAVCQAIKGNLEKYLHLGAIPIEDIEEECRREQILQSRNAINTRWHTEVEFGRIDRQTEAATAVKYYEMTLLCENVIPPGISQEQYLMYLFRSVFARCPAPSGSRCHHRSKLFLVRVPLDGIYLFQTTADAEAAHLEQLGRAELAKAQFGPWDLAFSEVEQTIQVDSGGKAKATVCLSMVNLSAQLCESLPIQAWPERYELLETPKADAALRDGRKLKTSLVKYGDGQSTGQMVSMCVGFPAIGPGETVSLSYTMPCQIQFHPGDNFFNMHIMCLHGSFCLRMCFADCWRVRAPILYVGQRDRDVFQPVLVDTHMLEWKRLFPLAGQIHTLFFHLSKVL
jgi:hypothetical protein